MTTVNDSPFSLINFNDMKQIFSEYQGQGSESQDKIIHRHPNIFNSSGEYLFMPFLDTFIRYLTYALLRQLRRHGPRAGPISPFFKQKYIKYF